MSSCGCWHLHRGLAAGLAPPGPAAELPCALPTHSFTPDQSPAYPLRWLQRGMRGAARGVEGTQDMEHDREDRRALAAQRSGASAAQSNGITPAKGTAKYRA
eukprot:3782682-Pleurochrysis_carterae.AAC.4